MLYQVNDVGVQATRSDVLPLQMIEFEGRKMPAPARPEVFLGAAYGPSWRIPDPGFSFNTALATRRRMSGWLGGLRPERDQWVRYYDEPQARAARDGSDFARWVAGQEPDAAVIDVGCGVGNDALYFAGLDHRVTGVDFAGSALRQARRRVAGQPGDAKFVNLNLYSVSESFRFGARLSHQPGRRIVYARGMLDVVRAEGRDGFWRLCSMALRGGQRCYVEVHGETPVPSPTLGTSQCLGS